MKIKATAGRGRPKPGEDVRKKCSRLTLEAQSDDDKEFLAMLYMAIVHGKPIVTDDGVEIYFTTITEGAKE